MGQPATTPHVTCTTITTNPYNLQPSSSLQPAVVRRSTVFPSAASTDTTFDDITSATSTTTTATSFNNITSATDVFFTINDTTTRWSDTLQVRRRRQVLLEEEAQTEVDELTTQSHASSPTPATTTLPGQGRFPTLRIQLWLCRISIKNTEIGFRWVPDHDVAQGNEQGETAALPAVHDLPVSYRVIPLSDYFAIISSHLRNRW
nr:uncharacterized protein LOC128704040 [Cherax quadricarinatus]